MSERNAISRRLMPVTASGSRSVVSSFQHGTKGRTEGGRDAGGGKDKDGSLVPFYSEPMMSVFCAKQIIYRLERFL